MYCKFFGFDELPFSVTPDPRFNYNSPMSADVLNRLLCGIEERKGFILLSGEAGTGKTTLMRRVMRSFSDRVDYAYIFNPRLKFVALLRAMLKDLGIPAESADKELMLDQLNSYVLQQHTQGRIVTCIFDEAQGLSDNVLEELRLLGNLETDREKLIQIVLVGQRELEWRLDKPNMQQFKQRISQRIVLQPLQLEELGAYLAARLSQAGYKGREIFDAAAIERIGRYSRGIPRLINTICDNVLARAWRNGIKHVSAELIDDTAMELCLVQISQAMTSPPSPLIGHQEIPQGATVAPNLAGTVRESIADAVDESEANVPLPLTKIWRARLGLLASTRQARVGFTALAAVFGLALGNLALSLMERQVDNVQQVKVAPIKAQHSRAPAVIVMPAALPALSGEDVRSARSKVPAPNVITPTPDRGAEFAQAVSKPQPAAVQLHDVNRPVTRTVFRVSEASFLRNRPAANADVIATLRPGIRIEVTALGGEYFRVRALGAEDINGFVHKEDAFFEPVH